jgi:hypothetical protein
LSVARPQLARDPGVSYPQGGGPIGAALTEFGSQITAVAGAYQARKQRQDIFDGNLREEEYLSGEALSQQDAVANAPSDGSDMVAGLYGEVDPKTGAVVKPGSFDKRFDEAAARMPEGKVRDDFLKKRELYRLKGQQKMAPLQISRRREYEEFETQKQTTKFMNEIAQADPDDPKIIADFKARGEAMINARDMDALDKEKAIVEWNQNAEKALALAMTTKDPSRVRGLLGMPKPGEGGGGGNVRLDFKSGGEAELNPRLVGAVKQAFAGLGIGGAKINSGYRSEAKNKAVGGAEDSQHLDANAMDIDVSGYSVDERRRIVAALSAAGVTGIGIGNTTIHADMGRRRAWGYRTSAGGADVPEAYADIIADHRAGKLTGGGGDPVANVVNKIIGAESGGDPTAKNERSSASGLGQFTDGTWLATIRKHRPDLAAGLGDRVLLAMKTDRALGREMTTALTKDNAEFLRGKDIPVTEANIYLAHFAGQGGAEAIFKASDESQLASVLDAATMNANPHLQGKTVGWIKDWAAEKMGGPGVAATGGGAGAIDPRFGNLTLEQRLALANAADSAVAEQMAALRADLDVITTNAPVAIQNTGVYTGATMPGQEDFIKAYGADTGPDKYRTFQASVETAESVYAMQKMPEAEIQSMLKAAAPLATGDAAALGAAKYASLEAAAEATMKARAADPAGYVSNAFPNVQQAWQSASRAAPNQRADAYSRAVAASIAAQEQLGIKSEDVQPLPKNIADNAVKVFKDVNVPEEDRIQAAAVAVASTPDPKQQQAIFEQLVDAGMPEITQGAFRALSRGDEGAARRLFQASIVDPTKLPGKVAETPAVIEQSIQDALMQEGQVGDIYYGLSDGVAENFVKAERDAKLMTNAVNMRLRQGEELESAVAAVAKDLYGDVQIVTGDGRANMQILMPAGENPEPIIDGLEAQMPAVRTAVEATLAVPSEVKTSDGTKAVLDAVTQNHADNVMTQGYFRNAEADDSYVFIDPYTGAAISDATGEPIIFKPAKVPPRQKGPVTDSDYGERTPEAGAGPSVDEFGNPVVLPK